MPLLARTKGPHFCGLGMNQGLAKTPWDQAMVRLSDPNSRYNHLFYRLKI
jgi:hypothetical protein